MILSELNRKAQELAPWLALHSVDGLGPVKINALIRKFGNPRKVLEACSKDLFSVQGVTLRLAELIELSFSPMVWTTLAEELLCLAHERSAIIAVPESSYYPCVLRDSPYRPPYLYICHQLLESHFSDYRTVAIVGSRNPTPYAERMTGLISRHLSIHGCTVVSGLAKGVDQVAHSQCIRAGGKTLAFVGSGVDVINRLNLFIRDKIVKNGAVISTSPMGSSVTPARLMMRNSYIVAASQAVILIQAGEKGGSMDSARKAIRMKKPLFALEPKSWEFHPDLKKFAGNVALIESGQAQPICGEDSYSKICSSFYRS